MVGLPIFAHSASHAKTAFIRRALKLRLPVSRFCRRNLPFVWIMLPQHQDLPNILMPLSNDSGYHELPLDSSPKSLSSPALHEPCGGSSPASSDSSSSRADDDDDASPINRRDDVGLSDQQLVLMETKNLNKLIKKKNISKERAKELKLERRTLKNRGYAANCRVKREGELVDLEKINEKLKSEIHLDQLTIEKAKRELQTVMAKFRDKEVEFKQLQNDFSKFYKEENRPGLQELSKLTEIEWEKV